MKKFALNADQIKPLAAGRGECIATERITVDGMPVGYMVREPTTHQGDSGWCFMAGDETQDYMDDPSHLGIYDVNTIANYSPDIVLLLEAQPHSAFERNTVTGKLVAVMYEAPLD
jgi:hypothetical protein